MTWIGSPNYTVGRGGKKIEMIVVHHMAGTLASTNQVFQDTKRQTSAHYGIGRSGEVHQYVQEKDTAYHAGNYDVNQRSIGIEHEDLNADNYTDIEYQTSADIIRRVAKENGFPVNANTVRPHKAYISTACPGTLDIDRLIKLANGEDMEPVTAAEVDSMAVELLNRHATPQEIAAHTGKPFKTLYLAWAGGNPEHEKMKSDAKAYASGGGQYEEVTVYRKVK